MSSRSTGLYARLGAMMALEYFAFGSWKPTMGLVLSSNGLGRLIGVVFVFSAVAAILSPLFVGALADRFFPAQKVFGVLHLAGAVLLALMPQAVEQRESALFVVLLFVFMLFFQPTQAMPNNISFAHLLGRMRVFPYIRSLGTLAWIVAGLVVGQNGMSARPQIFYLAAAVSAVLGVYSFTLPSTPPLQRGERFRAGDVIGIGAFPLLRRRRFLVLMVCVLLTFVPISTYNDYGSTYLDAAGVHNVASIMSLGQAAEFVFMLLLPRLLKWVGYRRILITGACTWVVRCGIFLVLTHGQVWLAMAVVALNGITTDFFMVTIYMYVDRMVAPALKAQAQGLVFFFQLGVGSLLGALVASSIYNGVIGDATHSRLSDWTPIWLVAGGVAVLTTLVMLFFLGRDEPERDRVTAEETRAPDGQASHPTAPDTPATDTPATGGTSRPASPAAEGGHAPATSGD
ncbi:MFS transporter [Streptomyces sp. NPDC059740]|uniref:MFS transporter n=1 Tax=Streptomyces sp. NPDC059740 TaxID=3346926 RepID=UPI0036548D3A